MKIKTLYVLAHFPQASEAYVEAEIAWMLSQGVQVEVWASAPGYGTAWMNVPIHRGPLKRAIDAIRPDVIHVHHMTTANYYLDKLPVQPSMTTVRAHSFDWDPAVARRLVGHPAIRHIFAFPHLAAQVPDVEITPMPVAYDPVFYYPTEKKNPRSVVRLSAGLPTKRLDDFIRVGNRIGNKAEFTLVMSLIIGNETQMVDRMTKLNQELGGHVKIRTNATRAEAAQLVRDAWVYMATADPSSHVFGMPVSIAEAMATGCYVIAPDAGPQVKSYLDLGGDIYGSIDEAVGLIQTAIRADDRSRESLGALAIRNAARFHPAVALAPLLEEWSKIVLENF
jgi:glycosyltransferase involved in cell wall biosynthesis